MAKMQDSGKIKELIKNSGLTVTGVAELAGIKRQNIEARLNGQYSLTSKYADILIKSLTKSTRRIERAILSLENLKKELLK